MALSEIPFKFPKTCWIKEKEGQELDATPERSCSKTCQIWLWMWTFPQGQEDYSKESQQCRVEYFDVK